MASSARFDLRVGFDFLGCPKVECLRIGLELRFLSETRLYDYTKINILQNNFDVICVSIRVTAGSGFGQNPNPRACPRVGSGRTANHVLGSG